MPVERVVVEGHLRVEGQQVASGSDDERIDLDERGVGGDERVVERDHHLGGLVRLRAVEAEREGELARLERHEPDAWRDVFLADGVRRLRRDFLDVHAAGGRRHDDGASHAAVEHEAQIQLALNREALFHQHARHDAPVGTGLVRLERHADQVAGDALGLIDAPGQLDAATLAAAAGVDLRLDDDRAAAEALGDLGGLGGREGDLPAGHGDTMAREDGLGLVFVDFHGIGPMGR